MIDGKWNVWSTWSTCSTTCHNGTISRIRSCSNPPPSHGGLPCKGSPKDTKSCYLRDCPVHGGWSSWTSWEACSATCGVGLTRRHRTCTNPVPQQYGHYCFGDPTEINLCNTLQCSEVTTTTEMPTPIPPCSDSNLNCKFVNETYYDVCSDIDKARIQCKHFCGLCNITDGQWTTWTDTGRCSVTCGDGVQKRMRACTNPAPRDGGHVCSGLPYQNVPCKEHECPVHGGWGVWTSWSDCSASCGSGLTHRRRYCDNPRPSLSGDYCFGDPIEYNLCIVASCAVNGGWTNWSGWGPCSKSCGAGLRRRERTCTNPPPFDGGRYCDGDGHEYQACLDRPCTVYKMVRLVNGSASNSGKVEVYDNGNWGSICDVGWDNSDATVVCRMLGYNYGTNHSQVHVHVGQGAQKVLLSNVDCSGTEPSIELCKFDQLDNVYCDDANVAHVTCRY